MQYSVTAYSVIRRTTDVNLVCVNVTWWMWLKKTNAKKSTNMKIWRITAKYSQTVWHLIHFIIAFNSHRHRKRHGRENKSSHRPHTIRQGETCLDPESVSGLSPKFNGDFAVHGYISGKIFMKIRPLSPGRLWKMMYLAMLKNTFKNSWIWIRRRMTSKI